jgi:uncharacterized membrane protein YbhN (UPF0104 family)
VKAVPRWARWSASVLVLALAAWLLWRQLRGLDPAQVWTAMLSLPPLALAASLAATALSFACLGAFERLATEWIAPGRIPRALAWRTGLVAHAVANTIGFHPITAVALRLEPYRAQGIDAGTLARIVATIGACVATGVFAILATAGAWWLWRVGDAGLLVLLVAASALLVLVAKRSRASLRLARPAYACLLGLVEMAAALFAFTVLVPPGMLPAGPELVLLLVSAIVLGVVSHAPGGLGVFEATILAAAAPGSRAPVLAALLAYRVLYGLLPFALALVALAGGAVRGRLSSTAGTRA